MTHDPLLSVIIPVYNVAAYLRRCLDSVLAQTYTRLDIIIVDDGSTDGGGAVCDEYAGKDERVTVIHQANAGLSCARNRGLEAARGELAAFVDSDDWLAPGMYARMIQKMEESGARIVMCGHYRTDGKRRVERLLTPGSGLLTAPEAIDLMVAKYYNGVWDKVYDRALFTDLGPGAVFPPGRYCEDLFVTHRLFLAAGSVYFINECEYFYYKRTDSILFSKSYKLYRDEFDANLFRYNDLKSNPRVYPGTLDAAFDKVFDCAFKLLFFYTGDGNARRAAAEFYRAYRVDVWGAPGRAHRLKAAAFVFLLKTPRAVTALVTNPLTIRVLYFFRNLTRRL